jgi:hypothetical protein
LIASWDRLVRDRLLLVLLAGNIVHDSNLSATIHTATLSLSMQTLFHILEASICQAKIRTLPDRKQPPTRLYCVSGKRI